MKDIHTILSEILTAGDKIDFRVIREFQEKYPERAREIAEAVSDLREFEFFACEDLDDAPPSDAVKQILRKFGIFSDEDKYYASGGKRIGTSWGDHLARIEKNYVRN